MAACTASTLAMRMQHSMQRGKVDDDAMKYYM
jgi:hypothetical protein